MVLIWTLVRRGRCWVCWWTPTVVSTSTSTAWTRAWRRRTSLHPATPSSTSTASVNRSALQTLHQLLCLDPFWYWLGVMSQFSVLTEQNPVILSRCQKCVRIIIDYNSASVSSYIQNKVIPFNKDISNSLFTVTPTLHREVKGQGLGSVQFSRTLNNFFKWTTVQNSKIFHLK